MLLVVFNNIFDDNKLLGPDIKLVKYTNILLSTLSVADVQGSIILLPKSVFTVFPISVIIGG